MPNISFKTPWRQTGLRWLWIMVIFFIFDQWTKQYAVSHLFLGERFEVMPFFNFILVYNKGAAFSLFANQPGWQVYFFATISTVVSLGLLYWLYTLPAKNKWLSIALCLILAGAMGNLYDRVTLEKVVDFIDWYYGGYHFPAFNIADSVILLGALMMLFDNFFNPQENETNKKQVSNKKEKSNE